MDYFVDSKWLNAKLNDENILVIDCNGRQLYEQGHIPGAVCLPIDYWLKENNENNIARGEKLIDAKDFSNMVSKFGINKQTTVITYDSQAGKPSIRVWWVFKYFGHDNIKVLRGGWKSWLESGFAVTKIEPEREASKYDVSIDKGCIIDKEGLFNNLSQLQIVDSRSSEEWSGQDYHGNPRAGRIPNSIHMEWSIFLESMNSLTIDFEKAREIVEQHSIDGSKPIVTYCQSGVRAAFVAFVLKSLGFNDVRVYDGSMHEWSRDDNLPLIKDEL